MSCNHQITLCKLHDCTKCEFVGNETECKFAYIKSINEAYPTFRQMLEVYAKSDVKKRRFKAIESIIQRDVCTVGLSLDSRCIEMTRSKFKTLIQILESPIGGGESLRGATIESHIGAFRAISSESLEEEFSENGLELPVFSIPKLKFKRQPVQEVSDRTIRQVEIRMERWLASGKRSDRDAFVFCFFALYCGMRAGDICSVKWDIIKHTTSGIMVVYTPRKTSESNAIKVSFLMDNKTFCKIEPLIEGKDDYVITRHPDRIPGHTTKNGEFSGMHNYLRNKVNKMLSECGIGNEYRGQKKAHALRKYFETDRVFKVGNQQAADDCGHSVRQQKMHYLGTLIGKIS